MIPVAPYPFLRLAICFMAGILAFVYRIPHTEYALWGAGVCSVFFCLLFFCEGTFRQLSQGVVAGAICFSIGVYVSRIHSEILDDSHFTHKGEAFDAYVGVVDEELVAKNKTFATKLRVQSVCQNNIWAPASGNVLVYIPKSNEYANLKYGDWVVIKGNPSPVANFHQDFDYRQFLGFKNIYHQHFIAKEGIARLHNDPPSLLWDLAYRARSELSSRLQRVLGDGQEFAVASMIILGIRQVIDQELLNAYASSGAMHVLAVSGLHVGLIFGLLQLLLGRLEKRKKWSHLFYGIAILAIWSFGLVTAFSPSVLRAVVMFSIIILGKWVGRKGNLYNTLGLTVFAILLCAPFMLMNIGFQMSFLAVLGIAYFQPKWQSVVKTDNRLIKWTWEITCVSVSAQVFTFPISLLYFNQFPTYFLVSNLWVIPASTLILYLGIAFFTLSFWQFGEWALGWLLKVSVACLNKSMFLVTYLPSYIVRNLYFDKWEVLLLYLLIISLILLFYLKRTRLIYFSMSLGLLFAGSRILKMVKHANLHQVELGTIKESPYISVRNSTSVKVWVPRKLLSDETSLNSFVLHPLATKGVRHISFEVFPEGHFVWQYGGINVAFCAPAIKGMTQEVPKNLDIVWLMDGNVKNQGFLALNEVKHVILSGKGASQISDQQPNFWNLRSKGAFILDILPDGKYIIGGNR